MQFEFDQLTSSQIYFTLIQTVVPRPVAWILSSNNAVASPASIDNKIYNLAPFSYFTPVSSSPAVLAVSIGKKPDGEEKDTLKNIKQHLYATIHIAAVADAEPMTESSRTRPHGESELAAQDLELIQESGFKLPRLANSKVALDCEFFELHELGQLPQSLLLLKVNRVWIADEIATEQQGRLKVDIEKLDPIARLGANAYAGLSESFIIPRPK